MEAQEMDQSTFGKDLFERIASSFVFGAAGAVSLDMYTDLGWKAWLTAGAVAGIGSVVKGLLARFVGDKDSASLLPGVPAVRR
jgi:uncharacterized membrane protein YjjB (DUF3815 family)